MGFLADLFGPKPFPSHARNEVEKLIDELVNIGKTDDYLSERPGSPFNYQCRHTRAIAIGKRLDELGGLQLMEYVHKKVQKKLDLTLASHLEYAWAGIGNWA